MWIALFKNGCSPFAGTSFLDDLSIAQAVASFLDSLVLEVLASIPYDDLKRLTLQTECGCSSEPAEHDGS